MKLDEESGRDALPGFFKGYTLRSCLKYTAETRVYLVEKDGERYILKRAEGTFAAPLREEYAVLAALDYDFLPRALDCVELEGVVWLLRTYKEGRTLAQMVERRGPLAEREAIRVALAVCDVLTQLHGQVPPVIHRDIKPENIVISSEGTYSLIDMGTARRWREEAGKDTMVLGTRATAAPEQFGYAQTDMRADIYSMGMLLAFLTTGGYGRAKGDLSALSPRLQKIILKCTAFDPDKRYSGAAELACALRKAEKTRRVPPMMIPLVAGFAGVFLGLWLGRALFLPVPMLPSEPSPSFSQLPAGTVVEFQESLIEKAVRLQLGKKEDEPIYSEELEAVNGLYLCGDQAFQSWNQHLDAHQPAGPLPGGKVMSLEDLRMMPNLAELALDAQLVQDISPLKGLKLGRLSLEMSPISDIGALKEMPLVCLRIGGTYITDLDSVGTDSLRELEVSDLGRAGVASVARFTNLTRLSLNGSGVTDLSEIKDMTKLRSLDLTENSLRSLEGIADFRDLSFLRIANTTLSDLSPLRGLSRLEGLELEGSSVTDFTTLGEVPALRRLVCDRTQERLIRALYPDPSFEIETREE